MLPVERRHEVLSYVHLLFTSWLGCAVRCSPPLLLAEGIYMVHEACWLPHFPVQVWPVSGRVLSGVTRKILVWLLIAEVLLC